MHFHKSSWLTACGALFFLTLIELSKPVAFFWDDNVDAFLPWYTFNFEAVRHGVLPQINFYSYLGIPYLGSGQPAVFYPPIYMAVALAHAWGRPEISIEWLAWVHLSAAAVVVQRIIHYLGSSPVHAMLGGWLYATLPFIVCSTQIWIYDSYSAFYIPLIFICLERLMQQVTFPRVAALALVHALLFVSGAINYFALTPLFEVFYFGARFRWYETTPVGFLRVGFAWAAALFLGLLLALPSFGPVAHYLGEAADRGHPLSLASALEESIYLKTFLCSQIGIFLADPSNSYIFRPGWLFAGGSFLLPLLLSFTWRNEQVRQWSCLVAIAVILSTPAYVLIHELPGYHSLRWPAKNMFFACFFYALAFSAMLRAMEGRWSEATRLVILLTVVALNLFVAMGPESRNGSEALPRMAPEFHIPLERLREGRTVLVGVTHGQRFFPDYLGCNYPTLARVPAFAGYDPMVLAQNKREALDIAYIGLPWSPLDDSMAQHFSSWSVRYYFVNELSPALAYLQQHARFQPFFRNGPLQIFEDQEAAPLAFFEDQPAQGLPLQFGENELTVDLRGHPGRGTLSLSLIPLAGYTWQAPGGKWLPVAVAPAGRMRIDNVPGGGIVRVRFRERHLGLFLAVSLATTLALILGSASSWWRSRPRRNGGGNEKEFV